MSLDHWQDDNNRYLAASLRWLRARLQDAAPQEPVTRPAWVEDRPPKPRGRWARWFGGGTRDASTVALHPETKRVGEPVAAAREAREAAARTDPPPALVALEQRLGLSPFERDTLLLCAAPEFDPDVTMLYGRLLGSTSRRDPTFGLALSILEEPTWDALSSHRPLRRERLIEVIQPGSTPFTSAALRADERIVNYIKGLNAIDDRLIPLVEVVTPRIRADVSDSQRVAVGKLSQILVDEVDASGAVVQLTGTDVASKLVVAEAVSTILGRRLYRLRVEALPTQFTEIETLANLWERETLLLPVALFIDAEHLDASTPDAQAALRRLLAKGLGVVFLAVREASGALPCVGIPIEVRKPSATEQHDRWATVLGHRAEGEDVSRIAESLAGQFDLNLGEIRDLLAKVPNRNGTAQLEGLEGALWDRCRELARPRLDSLAQRLEPKATWDDLVLSAEAMGLMKEISGQVRERHRVYDGWGFAQKMNRGFGISALFAGESGTGKTMAAEVLANDLRLHLYRIDLSAVVSKFVGDTERNLRRLFDAAEQGGVILFFDEADALFGKRSEVKDSHDRYANIEINYLLQRMEAFSGLAILATNMKSALDQAFMRRLRFVVNFQFPGAKERRLIWEKALTDRTPKESLDFDRLSRLSLTGGSIHNIALHAAFLAARHDTPVTMDLLLAATRTEMRKLERPVNEAELR